MKNKIVWLSIIGLFIIFFAWLSAGSEDRRQFLIIGFAICLFFIVPLLIIAFRLRSRSPQGKHYKNISTCIFAICFIAFMFWDNVYSFISFVHYCAKDGGEHIYRVIENPRGYYHANAFGCFESCEKLLFEKKYDFLEINAISKSTNDLTEKPGHHRLSLAPKGSPKCKLYYEKYSQNEEDNLKAKERLEGPYCIASEPVSRLQSRYDLTGPSRTRIAPFIYKVSVQVKDIETGEILSEYNQYLYLYGWVIAGYTGGNMNIEYPSTYTYEVADELLFKTLKSNNRNRHI